MASFLQRPRVYFVAVIVVAGGYLLVVFARSIGGGVPAEFSDARLQGAVIAQNIVNLSSRSMADLEAINKLDKSGNFTEALNLVTAAVTRSQEIRDEAVKLSGELEKMTQSLSDLRSLDARQAALEAISNHLALISRLINYSGYFSQLLEVLRNKFTVGGVKGDRVGTLVNQINTEVTAINSFNIQAIQAMKKFDDLVKS